MRNKIATTLYFHPTNNYTGSTRVLSDQIYNQLNGTDISAFVVTKTLGRHGILDENKQIILISSDASNYRLPLMKYITPLLNNLKLFYVALIVGKHFKTFYINTIMPSTAALVGRILNKDIIYHVHEKFISPGFGVLLKEFIFNTTRAKRIFVSNYLLDQYPSSSFTSRVSYNKLSPKYLDKVKIRPVEQRELRNILMVSSFSRGKGVWTFVKLASTMPEYIFLLILSSDQETIDREFKNIPENLTVIGHQRDVHKYYRNADLLLNLSDPNICIETFGLTIVEAMAYGVPSIAPDRGGPKEIIENGVNGYCTDVTNLDGVARLIKKVLNHHEYFKYSRNALIKADKYV
jgi:L-malate glycosyltransferase